MVENLIEYRPKHFRTIRTNDPALIKKIREINRNSKKCSEIARRPRDPEVQTAWDEVNRLYELIKNENNRAD